MGKHTPGPWEIWQYDDSSSRPGIESGDCSIIVFGDGKADEMGIWGRDDDEAIANAYLIAAAPDLLEAVQGIRSFVEMFHGDLTKIDAAIAKATGEDK